MSRKRLEGKLIDLALTIAFLLKRNTLRSLVLMVVVSLAFFFNRGFFVARNVEAETGRRTTPQRPNPGTDQAGGPLRTIPETGTFQGDLRGNVPGSPGKSCLHASSIGKRHGEPDDCPRVTPTPTPTTAPAATITPAPTPTPISTPKPNEPPECLGLSAMPGRGGAVLSVSFTGSGADRDGGIMAFEFTFGDGQKEVIEREIGGSGSQTVTHSYGQSGIYQASLRVKDNNGEFSQSGESCRVKIVVEGEILGVQAPLIQPKTGVATGLTFGFLFSGLGGWIIKRFLI